MRNDEKWMMVVSGLAALAIMAGVSIAACPGNKCGESKKDACCSSGECAMTKGSAYCSAGDCEAGAVMSKKDASCPEGMCAAGAAMEVEDEPVKPSTKYAAISTAALAALLRSGTDIVLLDARSGKYDDGRRLPGAKALSDKATEEEALAAIGSKDKLVVAYCTNLKCPASKRLANRLVELGFENVMKYPEGIDDWEAKGHKVEKEKK